MGANMENASKLAASVVPGSARELTTSEFATLNGVKPNTVRQHLCTRGSYYGAKPQKRSNGRLVWPDIRVTLDA